MLAALVLSVAASMAIAPAAPAAQPIEGTWNYLGGQVLVAPTSGGPGQFSGTVVRSTTFGYCVHPVGEAMWTIAGGGSSYSGTHQWFNANDCAEPQQPGEATWRVRESGDRFLLDFCTAQPGRGAPATGSATTSCSTLERAKPPSEGSPPSPGGSSPSRGQDDPFLCSGPACLTVPSAARGDGCLRRGDFAYRFAVRLRRGERRSLRVIAAKFSLDWKPNGIDRRPPFDARVAGRTLTPGEHLLLADVRLRARSGGKSIHRRLAFKFDGCR